MIAELKGNVRVFARVRPFLPSDDADMNPESSLVVSADNATIRIRGSKGEEQQFTFDKAFNPSAAQEAIFGEVNEFVQSALDGYNGKTQPTVRQLFILVS
jgi:kinesin family protein C1